MQPDHVPLDAVNPNTAIARSVDLMTAMANVGSDKNCESGTLTISRHMPSKRIAIREIKPAASGPDHSWP
ncbi:unnamed protein product [Phytophthora lilii]|uniref:Unnamed protein product n=1 Tax=Phytophthora lilii TaxID=2077276 RepID=A0A9W6YEQ6_9STRA|nr:unnamed protein product [Phytophthora lilii]